MSFAYPLAVLAPLIIGFLYLINRQRSRAVPYSSITGLDAIPPSPRVILRKPVLYTLTALFVGALALGASRPEKITLLQEEYKSRNLMLALDLSKSMGTQDIDSSTGLITRIDAVKNVVSDFINARDKDRLGLVVFGSSGFLQAPLTKDHQLVSQMVERLELGLAGDGTAIGDGLGLSVKRIAEVPTGAKAIVLLTDGVNNSGSVNPIKASLIAKDLGIKIHTIGIGSNKMMQRGGFDNLVFGPGGRRAEFDEAMLKEIADVTGGVYFNASNLEGLKKVYEEIDQLEKTSSDEPERRIVEEYYYYLALGALGFYLLYTALAQTIFMKIP